MKFGLFKTITPQDVERAKSVGIEVKHESKTPRRVWFFVKNRLDKEIDAAVAKKVEEFKAQPAQPNKGYDKNGRRIGPGVI